MVWGTLTRALDHHANKAIFRLRKSVRRLFLGELECNYPAVPFDGLLDSMPKRVGKVISEHGHSTGIFVFVYMKFEEY